PRRRAGRCSSPQRRPTPWAAACWACWWDLFWFLCLISWTRRFAGLPAASARWGFWSLEFSRAFPLPLDGGGLGRGWPNPHRTPSLVETRLPTPHPNPPPQGGRVQSATRRNERERRSPRRERFAAADYSLSADQ